MQLTPNFKLSEFTNSAKAIELGLSNEPTQEIIEQLRLTALMTEEIRTHLTYLAGKPIPVIITSGYRSPAVNKAVGSRSSSDHLHGTAADIQAPAFGTPYQVARALQLHTVALGIGQLILERVGGKSWVHVSTAKPAKAVNEIITVTDAGTFIGLQEAA